MQKTILTPNALQTDNTNTQTNSTNTNINLQNVPDAGGMTGHAIPIGEAPLPSKQYRQLQSKDEVNKRLNEEIDKIKFPLKTTLITSAVPLGLAYFSYNQKYSLTKGISVVVIGSAVAFFGTIMFSKGKFV